MRVDLKRILALNNHNLQSSEKNWVRNSALLVMLLTSIPYFLAFFSQGSDWVFTGFLFGVEDGNSYIAKMLSGYYGEWLFRTPYTTSPQTGAFVFIPYILLGKLAWGESLHLSMVILFHIFRIVAGYFALIATYKFVSVFIQNLNLRKLAWGVINLGGGLGWIVVLLWGEIFGSLPLDFYSPESFGFLGIYGIPHLAAARAFFLLGLINYLNRDGKRAGLFWLTLGLFQPVNVIIGWVVVGAHIVGLSLLGRISKKSTSTSEWGEWQSYLKTGMFTIIVSSPLVIYSTVIFAVDPFLRAWKWTGQNLITSPHPIHYLLAYGLLLTYFVRGMKKVYETNNRKGVLLAMWIIILPALVYAPVDFQRRLAEGVWVAIVITAVIYMESIRGDFSRYRYAPFLLTIPSTIILLMGGILVAINASSPLFLRDDKVAAFEYLRETAQIDEVVLGSFETGNALPAWTPLRVVSGHGPESINFEKSNTQVMNFFDESKDDDTRHNIITENDVGYIFWGPDERLLGGWNPSNADYLNLVYENEEYQIFDVLN